MKRSDIAGHRFIVFGAARSGIAAALLLKKHGCEPIVIDEKSADEMAGMTSELDARGIKSSWGPALQALLDDRTCMILSPGIPQKNALVQEALRRGMAVISEIELASAFVAPGARVVSITGTNGKTTTTAWIAHLLACSGLNAVLAGNIGQAWTSVVDAPENRTSETVFVVEVSSYQLETIQDFHPNVAVLTNLAPDHMDRYDDTFSRYVDAKRNILRNMTAEDFAVINADNLASTGFAAGSGVTELLFSTGPIDAPGAFVRDGRIFFRDQAGETTDVLARNELPLPGKHNLENALAAVIAARMAGASFDGIRTGLRNFQAVEHRIEFCGQKDGVAFYNDSKATNIDSLEKALQSFEEKIVLIAGGRDKHSDYDSIRELVKEHVKHLITIGEAAPLIEKSWSDIVPTERALDMSDAVQRGAIAAGDKGIVILSPACASFDMYKNYEERGRDFKRLVKAFSERQ